MTNETETENVNVSDRAKKAGWNINSWIGLGVGFLSIATTVCTVLWVTANKSRDVEDLQTWRAGHEQLHKDRQIKIEGRDARVDERLKGLEDRAATTESDIKLLGLRTAANEQAVGQILASVKELTSSVNEVSADVKVMRAILQRQDANSNSLR